MPDTNPTTLPPVITGATALQTDEQRAAAREHDRQAAKDRVTFDLMQVLLPVLNERAPLSTLRYYLGQGIDVVAYSPDRDALVSKQDGR